MDDDNGSTPSSLSIPQKKGGKWEEREREKENSHSFKEKITYSTTCTCEPPQ
jgi:hypothetical protein